MMTQFWRWYPTIGQILTSGVLLGLSLATLPVAAQSTAPAQEVGPIIAPQPPADYDVPTATVQNIDFEADRLSYDDKAGIVTATGMVHITRKGQTLIADEVVYDRNSGQVTARGHVRLTDDKGNVATANEMQLTEELHDGIIENMLLVLHDGSRLAARTGARQGQTDRIDHGVYSPCSLCSKGKERPIWRIKAVRVTLDNNKKRVFYRDAYLEFFNVPLLYFPAFSHPSPDSARATGFLKPEIKSSQNLGFSLAAPYYIPFTPWRDITLTPTIYTNERPALGIEYRERIRGFLGDGTLRIGGTATYVRERDVNNVSTGDDIGRGFAFVDATLQHGPQWRSSLTINASSDDTFLRRYDISTNDTLRSRYTLERFGTDSYFSFEMLGFQPLRLGRTQGLVPNDLPSFTYWWRSTPLIFGGRLTVTANTASIFRTSGADSQRASLTLNYDIPWISPNGLIWNFTQQLRGDVYYQTSSALQDTLSAAYLGSDGVQTRFLPFGAIKVSWPLVGTALGGQQILEPILQLVVSPTDDKFGLIANEDSRVIDLDETNLFSLNRFPGYDRSDGGTRITYGLHWTLDLDRPGLFHHFGISTEVGQSYRTSRTSINFPVGTGLSNQVSDIVGRTSLHFAERFSLVHRFRLDHDGLVLRRNELDGIYDDKRFHVSIGYSNLNRGVGINSTSASSLTNVLAIEDIQDRQEIRGSARVRLTEKWSIIGSSIYDITGNAQPIRNSVGLLYTDDCFAIGFNWRRNYTQDRDFTRGSTFLFTIALRHLGGSR